MIEKRLDWSVLKDPSWWHWALTVPLLAAFLAGTRWALPLAAALCGGAAVGYYAFLRSWRPFPVQVRVAYLLMLFAGAVPYMAWLQGVQLVGTTAMITLGYCPLARMLMLAPWNRTQPFSNRAMWDALVRLPRSGGLVRGGDSTATTFVGEHCSLHSCSCSTQPNTSQAPRSWRFSRCDIQMAMGRNLPARRGFNPRRGFSARSDHQLAREGTAMGMHRGSGRLHSVVAGGGMLILMASAAHAENWPQFRGPAASGLMAESQLPTAWGPEENVAWKIKLPGVAWSQPVVWEDRIYVTSAVTDNQAKPAVGGGGRGGFGRGPGGPGRPDGEGRPPGDDGPRRRPDQPRGGDDAPGERPDRAEGDRRRQPVPGGPRRGGFGRSAEPPDDVYRWVVMCLDRDSGKVLWEQVAHEGKPTIPTHRTNTFASETPIVDGQRVYAYFGMTGLFCYDLDGKLLWQKDLGSYPMSNGWGTGSSPALDGDRLFVQCDNEEDVVPGRARQAHRRRAVARRARRRIELVDALCLEKQEPHRAGHRRRRQDAFVRSGHRQAAVGTRAASTAAARPRRWAPTNCCTWAWAADAAEQDRWWPFAPTPTGELDVADKDNSAGIAWTTPRAGPPMASPLVYDGPVYVLEQRGGIIGCYDAKTGEERYHKRHRRRQRLHRLALGRRRQRSSAWTKPAKPSCSRRAPNSKSKPPTSSTTSSGPAPP